MKKLKVDVTTFCNYDGLCKFSDKNQEEEGHAFCYGEKFGTKVCPLKQQFVEFEVKNDRVKDVTRALED